MIAPAQPIDVAVWLGLQPRPLPPILTVPDLAATAPPCPPEIIGGILHRGCKLVLAGTSKTNKTWSLMDLGLSVASGQPWWGRSTSKDRVLYLNFELPPWALLGRVRAICEARPELEDWKTHFYVWNLRGWSGDFTNLRPALQKDLEKHDFGLLIVDPAYKLLGDRDENSNGEITSLMNEFERLATETGAAVVVAHHFAKGDSTLKDPIDRMSGAGAWARDPDSILLLTPHEERCCYTVNSILRNMRQIPEFVLAWEYPIMRLAPDLDPAMVRTRQRKAMTDREFVSLVVGPEAKSAGKIIAAGRSVGLSERSVYRYLRRATGAGTVKNGGGLYWATG